MPSTLQEYLFLVLCLLILAFTMALHVTLSAERMRLDQRLAALKEEHARTERINANLVWEISQSTSLDVIHAEAVARGYAPITEFKYVVADSTSAQDASVAGAEVESRDRTDAWSVVPSVENPVIVFASPDTTRAQTQVSVADETALMETPGMQTDLAGSSSGFPITFASTRAAARETWNWVMDRLPDWRFPWQ